MGLFDELTILGKDADLIVCATGHSQTDVTFQTKDFNENMDRYYLHRGELWVRPINWGYDPDPTERRIPPFVENGELILRTDFVAQPTIITQSVRIYTNCRICKPTVWRKAEDTDLPKLHSPCGDRRTRSYPWVEYQLIFIGGRLTHTEIIKLQTREEDIQEMSRNWVREEDDPEYCTGHY